MASGFPFHYSRAFDFILCTLNLYLFFFTTQTRNQTKAKKNSAPHRTKQKLVRVVGAALYEYIVSMLSKLTKCKTQFVGKILLITSNMLIGNLAKYMVKILGFSCK